MRSTQAPVDVDRYEELGFLADVPVFSSEEIDEARSAFARLEAAAGQDVATKGLVDRHLSERFVWDLATDPRILDVIEAIVGPDVLLLASHFFCKYPDPEGTVFVAWHQDVTYWGIEPPQASTAWIAIDDVDVENGCMRVIPGSHRRGIAEHGTSDRHGNILSVNQEIPRSLVDEASAYDVELPAGHMSVHDGHLIHGSAPNVSTRRRCGLAVRFSPARVRPADPEHPRWHAIPVRGSCAESGFTLHPPPFT